MNFRFPIALYFDALVVFRNLNYGQHWVLVLEVIESFGHLKSLEIMFFLLFDSFQLLILASIIFPGLTWNMLQNICSPLAGVILKEATSISNMI